MLSGLMLLLLAGCFRSAGDSVEPTVDPAINPIVTDSADTAPSVDSPPGTPTLPPITILAPGDRNPALSTEETTSEVGAASGDATQPASGGSTIVPPPTATPQFITPGSPLSAIPFDEIATPESTGEVSRMLNPEATDAVIAEDCLYTIESGDSLYGIALDNDTTVDILMEANPDLEGDPPVLFPGDQLLIPDCDPALLAAVEADEEETDEADETDETDEPDSEATAVAGEVYRVRPGDTLFTIAQRFGVRMADIIEANDLTNPDRLNIGQELIIPVDEDE